MIEHVSDDRTPHDIADVVVVVVLTGDDEHTRFLQLDPPQQGHGQDDHAQRTWDANALVHATIR